MVQPVALRPPPTTTGGYRQTCITGRHRRPGAPRQAKLLRGYAENRCELPPLDQRHRASTFLDLAQILLGDASVMPIAFATAT
jgi:hypothetical protein